MHSIALFVSRPAVCNELALEIEASRSVPLQQELGGLLLFAADGASIFSVDIAEEACAFSEFQKLKAEWATAAARASYGSKIAYLETEYYGGQGAQAAIVWERGHVVVGPMIADYGPVNSALRFLGVRAPLRVDEFDAIGFGAVRQNEDFAQ